MLIYDAETNGLLDAVTKVHCLVIRDMDTGKTYRFNEQRTGHGTIRDGLAMLGGVGAAGRKMASFNGIKFDREVFKKLYDVSFPEHTEFDAMVAAQVVWPDVKSTDAANAVKWGMPGNLRGRHSLEAWGYRLGIHKIGYTDWCKQNGIEEPWACWRQEMEDYCVGDIEVTEALVRRIEEKNWPIESMVLEHRVAFIIAEQERYGVGFDEAGAVKLAAGLVGERAAAVRNLVEMVGDVAIRGGPVQTPKRPNKKQGIDTGCQFQKVKFVPFNPTSRQQIGKLLTARYGWQPTAYGADGHPQVDEKVLAKLPYPIVPALLRLFLIEKRIGQISEGNEAWLKRSRNGRLYGRVTPNGAVTGRATHSNPNLGQVPKVGKFLGAECRALFLPRGIMVGADLSGIELRGLAHYMAPFDGGDYVCIVVDGDVHSVNCRALGLEPKKVYTIRGQTILGRDIAKTFVYAFLYGAGAAKLGSIIGKGAQSGGKLKTQFLAGLPALKQLLDKVDKIADKRGFLVGLDGRRVPLRSKHGRLNMLLQSFGALVAKLAMVIAWDEFKRQGLVVHQVLWVHDEFQYDVDPSIAQQVGKIATWAMKQAGEEFGLRVAIAGEFKVGPTWAATH